MKKLFTNFGWVIIVAAFVSIACNTATNTVTNTNTNRTNVNVVTNANSNAVVVNANTNAAGDSFLTDAASGGIAEVELGKMASTKSQNAEVKKFAEMMVTDHSKAGDELKALAAKKNVTLPTKPIAKHQSVIDRLQGMSGAEFDKSYVEDMLEDHEKDVAEFEKQSQNHPDADVKAFAAKTLPTLKKHLADIKAIQAKMK